MQATRADADGRDEVIAVDATARRSDTVGRSVSVSFENRGGAPDSRAPSGVYALAVMRSEPGSSRTFEEQLRSLQQSGVATTGFSSRKFFRALSRNGMASSIGRVGAADDNAAMESFFSLLQKNLLARRNWSTREELRLAIVTWIERPYLPPTP